MSGDGFGSNFQPIFNGRNLDGWTGDMFGKSVSNGILHWTAGSNIYTDEQFADFIFRFEFTMTAGANNGLAIRSILNGDPAYDAMCELQILDNRAEKYKNIDPRQYHESAYGMAAAHRGYLRAPGEWNYQEVTVQDSTIRVTLNGI